MSNIKVSESWVYNSHGGDSVLNHRIGERITIMRPLRDDECDRDEVGPMFKVRFETDGFETDVFEDEIEYKPRRKDQQCIL